MMAVLLGLTHRLTSWSQPITAQSNILRTNQRKREDKGGVHADGSSKLD